VLIAHDKEEGDADSKSVRPDITGGSYSEVMKVSDFVGYLAMSGKTRVLDFNPTDKWVGKNPAAWRRSRCRRPRRPERARGSHRQGGAASGPSPRRVAIGGESGRRLARRHAAFTTADECNRAIPVIKKLPPVVAPQVSKLLIDHAATLGIAFDKATKPIRGLRGAGRVGILAMRISTTSSNRSPLHAA